MTQQFQYLDGDTVICRELPDARQRLVPGVRWGRVDVVFTPAYWMGQLWMWPMRGDWSYRSGETLAEEITVCLLGGHGISAEIGMAAFERLRERGFISSLCDDAALLSATLREPLRVGERFVTYRFWSRKADFLASAYRTLREGAAPPSEAQALREYLLRMPGIGLKTASWIVRNWLRSDEVAILDIHIIRAGRIMGLFGSEDRVERHYLDMERRFLELCRAMQVSAADLDAVIWYHIRQSPTLVDSIMNDRPLPESAQTSARLTSQDQLPLL